MFEKKIREIKERTEIIILPEMFSTGFRTDPADFAEKIDGPSVEWMKKMAGEKNAIITGSLIIEEEGAYYNRLIWALPNSQLGFYDKRHLFAFAGEDNQYKAGRKRLIASVKGWRVNLLVCYDLRFPVWSRQAPSGPEGFEELEYDLLIYVANWPDRRSHAWKSLLLARAIENQCFVAGVNRTGEDGNGLAHSGDSMMLGPLGEIFYHGRAAEEVFTMTLEKEHLIETRKKFPFWRDADDFAIHL
jgi:predicted amidohydrolase